MRFERVSSSARSSNRVEFDEHSAALLLERDLAELAEESLADAGSACRRRHVQVLEVEAILGLPRRVREEVKGEADDDAALLGLLGDEGVRDTEPALSREERLAQELLGRLDLVERLLIVGLRVAIRR
jgi:hypothetical protein